MARDTAASSPASPPPPASPGADKPAASPTITEQRLNQNTAVLGQVVIEMRSQTQRLVSADQNSAKLDPRLALAIEQANTAITAMEALLA